MPGRLVQHGQALDLGDFEVGFGRAFGTPVESVSLLVMRWALLSLGLLGAILYVTGTFTPSPEEPSGSLESAALVWPDDAQLDTRPGLPTHAIDPSAPSPQEATPSITRQAQPATSQTSETQEPLLNDPAAPIAALPSDHPEQHSWGQLLRGAPVHSGPSVSSAILGHAAAGTEMQLLERNLGWARIRDPGTSREGWIYEEHITLKGAPTADERRGSSRGRFRPWRA